MAQRFIDRFDVILLDMGCTFMFEVDRFSEHENFGATYRRLGGDFLSDREVNQITLSVLDTLLADYEGLRYCDSFPLVSDYLKALVGENLSEREFQLLEDVFALHEIGVIPQSYAVILHQLSQTHRLGVVSNIWSRSDRYFEAFERAGIRDLFEAIVFSSDYKCIKPSTKLFAKAVELVDVQPSKILFVGDSLKFDCTGAKSTGLSMAWINADSQPVMEMNGFSPDYIIQDLEELLS